MPGELSGSKPMMRFDVVSVKEDKSTSAPTSNILLDRGDAYTPTGGSFYATNQPLIAYLIFAYKVSVVETYGGLMASLPKWAIADRFDIQGKSDSPNVTKDDLRAMVRSVLEDRFRLAVHRKAGEVPAFLLQLSTPGVLGPQLKRREVSNPCKPMPPPPSGVRLSELLGVWPSTCGDGVVRTLTEPLRYRAGGRDMDMKSIASWLTGLGDLDRPILDGTGQAGRFDFVIEYAVESSASALNGSPVTESEPTFLQAIEDQLGLRIKRGNGTATFFVVDHVEYPSAN